MISIFVIVAAKEGCGKMSFLTKLTMVLQPESPEPVRFGRSSLLHGVLMERIHPAYAEELHQDGMRPYSQYVYKKADKNIWEINTLTKKAGDQLLLPIQSDDFTGFTLLHNHEKITIAEKHEEARSIDDLINTYYFGECSRYLNLQFVTPTAFRQAGKYVFYPDIALIYQSLINRFNQFAEGQVITLEDTWEDLCANTDIVSYRLKSIPFPLEGVSIPSFMGTICMRVRGPLPMVNLVHLMFHYGEYSGVGIKTALGMGKIEVIEKERRKHLD